MELTRRVREEHHEAVDTDAPATGGRKTVLESVNEGLVDTLSLIVALLLLPYL